MKRGGLNWLPIATFAAVARRGDRMLVLQITRTDSMPVEWYTLALESSKPPEDASVRETISQAFTDHQHTQLPACRTLTETIEQAEKYARWWRSSGATAEACDCEEIGE